MEFNSAKLIYFSPTKTTQKIIEGIAQGFRFDRIEHLDMTRPEAENQDFQEIDQELTILGTPVYGGRVPLVAIRRLKRIKAQGTPVLVVVVYGNREYEDALLELTHIAEEQGFKPIAAGAFIGEHSYSTSGLPIADGRPDEADMARAKAFGEMVFSKLKSLSDLNDLSPIKVPGNSPYKEGRPASNESPLSQETLCALCGTCASVCPTEAIVVEASVMTDSGLCILCQACVKNCPTGARIMEGPRIRQVVKWLNENCSKRKEPEIFL